MTRRKVLLGALLALTVFAAAAFVLPQPAAEVVEAAEADTELERRAVYALLRVAGLAWVTVEWTAALILIYSYVLLTRAFATRAAQKGNAP